MRARTRTSPATACGALRGVALTFAIATATTSGGESYLNADCTVSVWTLRYVDMHRSTVCGRNPPRNGTAPTPDDRIDRRLRSFGEPFDLIKRDQREKRRRDRPVVQRRVRARDEDTMVGSWRVPQEATDDPIGVEEDTACPRSAESSARWRAETTRRPHSWVDRPRGGWRLARRPRSVRSSDGHVQARQPTWSSDRSARRSALARLRRTGARHRSAEAGC